MKKLHHLMSSQWFLGVLTLSTILLAIIAITTALKISQFGTEPVAPTAPKSKPVAIEPTPPDSDTCRLTYTVPLSNCEENCTTDADCVADAPYCILTTAEFGLCSQEENVVDCSEPTTTPTPTPPPDELICGDDCILNYDPATHPTADMCPVTSPNCQDDICQKDPSAQADLDLVTECLSDILIKLTWNHSNILDGHPVSSYSVYKSTDVVGSDRTLCESNINPLASSQTISWVDDGTANCGPVEPNTNYYYDIIVFGTDNCQWLPSDMVPIICESDPTPTSTTTPTPTATSTPTSPPSATNTPTSPPASTATPTEIAQAPTNTPTLVPTVVPGQPTYTPTPIPTVVPGQPTYTPTPIPTVVPGQPTYTPTPVPLAKGGDIPEVTAIPLPDAGVVENTIWLSAVGLFTIVLALLLAL